MTPDRLSKQVHQILREEHTIVVSAVSSWEIATKHRLGKLPDVEELLSDFEGNLERTGFVLLSVNSLQARTAGSFPQAPQRPLRPHARRSGLRR